MLELKDHILGRSNFAGDRCMKIWTKRVMVSVLVVSISLNFWSAKHLYQYARAVQVANQAVKATVGDAEYEMYARTSGHLTPQWRFLYEKRGGNWGEHMIVVVDDKFMARVAPGR
jgi:hypothetical protein